MHRFILAAAAVLLATSGQAQDSIVVTAARLPQSSEQLVRAVTVITAEDIARSGQQSVADLLQTVGGLEISRNGGYGQLSSVFIRGANSNQTLVLIDGLRVSAATSGATTFENIPLALVDRIEIVPGPTSGLYGADAVGGVIQIFTKGAAPVPRFYASGGVGTYDTRSGSAGLVARAGATDFALSAGYFETGGFSATKPSIPFGQHHPDRDGYRNASASARITHRLGTGYELGLTMLHSEGRTWFDSGAAFDDVSDARLSAWSLHAIASPTERWRSELRWGEGRDELDIRGAFPTRLYTRQPQLTWQNVVGLGSGSLIAGAERLEQRIESNRVFARTRRDIVSAFAGYSGTLGEHAYQLNGRYDDNDQFGAHGTGNAAYAYRVLPTLRLRAGFGTAFKSPTFNDLYFPGFSNPDLRPERSRNREAGVDIERAGQGLAATYFDNRIRDLIVFDGPTSRPQNIIRARIRGVELAYRVRIDGFQGRATLTVQDPENELTGRLLQRRAREHGTLEASYGRAAWRVGLEAVASSRRFDAANESAASRMHGYAFMNLVAEYAPAPAWKVLMRWNNVTDREYELAQHYNTPGSNVLVSLQFRPGTP